jgi:hypothetical protein
VLPRSDVSEPSVAPVAEDRTARNVGVGCFTAFAGTVSGSMVGVLLGKVTSFFQRCRPTEGLPACNWHWYALGGAALGLVTLPSLVLWRLRRADGIADRAAERSNQSDLKRG